eukprot:INCI17292.1.p1 GENE.INCI17292.1~~INCI17292.1.p1  ORF type:complete len:2000 (-),score=360.72 INCI17292.1:184-6183(-)
MPKGKRAAAADPFQPVLSPSLLATIRQRQKQETKGVRLPPVRGAAQAANNDSIEFDVARRLSTADAQKLAGDLVEEQQRREDARREREKRMRKQRKRQLATMKLRAIRDHDDKYASKFASAASAASASPKSSSPTKGARSKKSSKSAGGHWHMSDAADLAAGDSDAGAAPDMQFILFNDVHPHHVRTGLRVLQMPRTKYLQSVHTTFHMCCAMISAIDHTIVSTSNLVKDFCDSYIASAEDGQQKDDENGPETADAANTLQRHGSGRSTGSRSRASSATSRFRPVSPGSGEEAEEQEQQGEEAVLEALFSAIREDCDELIPFLLSGDDTLLLRRNEEQHNVLMAAVGHASEKCTEFIMNSRHAPELATQQARSGGVSALMLAAARGKTDTTLAILNLAQRHESNELDTALDILRMLQQHLETHEPIELHANTGEFVVAGKSTSTTLEISVTALVLLVLSNSLDGIDQLLTVFFSALEVLLQHVENLEEPDGASANRSPKASSKGGNKVIERRFTAQSSPTRRSTAAKRTSSATTSSVAEPRTRREDDGGALARRGIMPLCFAVMAQNRPAVQLLLDAMQRLPPRRRLWGLGEDLATDVSGRSLEGILCGDINQEVLRGSGARVLHLAVYLQNADIVEDLLRAGADPNLVAKFCIHNVPGRQFSPFASFMHAEHPLDIQDITPLDIAVLSGNFFTTRELLRHGAFVDHCDTLSGNTPAMIAAAMRDFDVLGLLIDFGASRARQNNEGMPLEAILQELHRVTVNAAIAEGATQRIRLLQDQEKIEIFCREALAYLSLHRPHPDEPAPDLFDPMSYPTTPNAHNAMPLLNWDVVFEIGVKAALWESSHAIGLVDQEKIAEFAKEVSHTSWILSPVSSEMAEHNVVDMVRFRARRAVPLSAAELLNSPSVSRASEANDQDPHLRYGFEVDIGVAVALENDEHSAQLKCGAPNVMAALHGKHHLRHATTTLLEFLAVYHRQRRKPPATHHKAPDEGLIVMPPVRLQDLLSVAQDGADVLGKLSFARHAAAMVHHKLARMQDINRNKHSSLGAAKAQRRSAPKNLTVKTSKPGDSVSSKHRSMDEAFDDSSDEAELLAADKNYVHPLSSQRLRFSVLLDVWARVEREFMGFPQGGPARIFETPVSPGGTVTVRPLISDASMYQTSCAGYMDRLLPTISRLRAVDAVAGTSMLQQFAVIGATLREGMHHCKQIYDLTATIYRMRAFWAVNAAELQTQAYAVPIRQSTTPPVSQATGFSSASDKLKALSHRNAMSKQLLACCMLNDTRHARDILVGATKRGMLESANINVNAAAVLSGHCSALLVATMQGNSSLMRLLLAHGANVDFVASRRADHVAGLDLGGEKSHSIGDRSDRRFEVEHVTALMVAVVLQDIAALEVLLEFHPDPRIKNADSQSVFHMAAIVGNADVMKLLVSSYAANHSGMSAAGANLPTSKESVSKRKTEENQHPQNAVHTPSEGQRSPTVDINDTAGAQGFTALFFAAACGHNDTVQALCDASHDLQVDLDTLTVGGITPLIAACYHNSEGTARALLHAGADPNVIMRHNGANSLTGLGTDGTSAVQLALFHGDRSLLTALLSHGAHAPRDDQEIAAVCADYDLIVLMAQQYARQWPNANPRLLEELQEPREAPSSPLIGTSQNEGTMDWDPGSVDNSADVGSDASQPQSNPGAEQDAGRSFALQDTSGATKQSNDGNADVVLPPGLPQASKTSSITSRRRSTINPSIMKALVQRQSTRVVSEENIMQQLLVVDGAAAPHPAVPEDDGAPIEPTFSSEAIAVMDAMDFRALHLVQSLHGLDSAAAVYCAGISQLEAYDGTQKRLFSDLHNIFAFYNIDQRKGRVELSVLRDWLKDLEIHTFYGTEFPHFTRSLFRPRLVVHTVDDSCPEAEVGLFPLAVSTISTTLTNGQTVLLREDDSEDEDQLRKKKASTRSLRDFEADDELRRRRKRHEVESALNFPAFMRLYFTLDRLVSHERVAVSNYLGAVVSCCR